MGWADTVVKTEWEKYIFYYHLNCEDISKCYIIPCIWTAENDITFYFFKDCLKMEKV